MEDILTPFNQYFIFNTITSDFMQDIKIHECCNYSSIEKDEYKWLNNFYDHIKPYNKELHLYISLGIIKSLGLDYKKILPSNWYKQKDYKLFKRNWYIDYYSFICLSQTSNYYKTTRFSKKLNNSNLTKSDILSKLWQSKRAAKVTISPFDVFDILNETDWINSNYQIDWNISTALNRNAEWIIIDILRNPFYLK